MYWLHSSPSMFVVEFQGSTSAPGGECFETGPEGCECSCPHYCKNRSNILLWHWPGDLLSSLCALRVFSNLLLERTRLGDIFGWVASACSEGIRIHFRFQMKSFYGVSQCRYKSMQFLRGEISHPKVVILVLWNADVSVNFVWRYDRDDVWVVIYCLLQEVWVMNLLLHLSALCRNEQVFLSHHIKFYMKFLMRTICDVAVYNNLYSS